MRTRMSSSLRGASPADPGGPGRKRLSSVNRGRGGSFTGRSGPGPGRRAALLDDRLQVVEVTAEGVAAGRRQPAGRLRPAAGELLVDGDVAGALQLLPVDAEVAVGHLQRVAQLGERQR